MDKPPSSTESIESLITWMRQRPRHYCRLAGELDSVTTQHSVNATLDFVLCLLDAPSKEGYLKRSGTAGVAGLSPVRLILGVGGRAVESKSWMFLFACTDMLRTLNQAVCVIGNNHRRGEAWRL